MFVRLAEENCLYLFKITSQIIVLMNYVTSYFQKVELSNEIFICVQHGKLPDTNYGKHNANFVMTET